MRNSEQFGSGEMSVEEKAEILSELMYRTQPDFEDFRGEKGFSDYDLRNDQRKLDDKNRRDAVRRGAIGDRYAKEAEPIVTFALNHDSFLPSRDTFSYLASEFDDKINGTDVVLGIERKDHRGHTVFSVDVATGTNAGSISEKFRVSERNYWAARINYCIRDNRRWSEAEAPHFILGMMPASLDRAMDHVRIGDGTLVREPDATTDFILASEMYEQINMQIADIETGYQDELAERQLSKLKEIRPAVKMKLYKLCNVKGDTKEARAEDFAVKYAKNKQRMRGDLVYRNIIDEVRHRNDRNNGRKVTAAV